MENKILFFVNAYNDNKITLENLVNICIRENAGTRYNKGAIKMLVEDIRKHLSPREKIIFEEDGIYFTLKTSKGVPIITNSILEEKAGLYRLPIPKDKNTTPQPTIATSNCIYGFNSVYKFAEGEFNSDTNYEFHEFNNMGEFTRASKIDRTKETMSAVCFSENGESTKTNYTITLGEKRKEQVRLVDGSYIELENNTRKQEVSSLNLDQPNEPFSLKAQILRFIKSK